MNNTQRNIIVLLSALVLAGNVAVADTYLVIVKSRVVDNGSSDCGPTVKWFTEQQRAIEMRLLNDGFSPRRGGSAREFGGRFAAAIEVHVALGPGWIDVEDTEFAGRQEFAWLEKAAARSVMGSICGCDYGRGGSFPWRFDLPSPGEVIDDLRSLAPHNRYREYQDDRREREYEERLRRQRREEEQRRREADERRRREEWRRQQERRRR